MVFKTGRFLMPENADLTALYQGEAATGTRFIDNAVSRIKVLDLPKLKLQIIVEPNRLRVEDNSQEEPGSSPLIKEAIYIYQKLFAQFPLNSFGFNFDIYYRFSDVIRLNDLFNNFVEPKILEKTDLGDLGIQFTLEKEGGKKQEQYFIKITAPLEIVVHANHHFLTKELPFLPPVFGASALDKERIVPIQQLFEKLYGETDEIIQNLKF